MAIAITGQAPQDLNPHDITPPLVADASDPGKEYDLVEVMTALVDDVLMKPLVSGTPASAVDTSAAKPLTNRELAEIIVKPLLPSPAKGLTNDDQKNNAASMDLLSQMTVSLAHGSYPFVRQFFTGQALSRHKLPAPGPKVFYTAGDDVIPSAKKVLSAIGAPGPDAYDKGVGSWDLLSASIGAAFKPSTFGVGMLNDSTFSRFTEHLLAVATGLSGAGRLPSGVLAKCQQLAKLKLDGLTEALILRSNEDETTEDYSFARLLVHEIHAFDAAEQAAAQSSSRSPQSTLMAFDLVEWVMPQTVVFVSAEAHARRSEADVLAEWKGITRTLTGGLKIVSPHAITKLNALPSALAGMKMAAVNTRKESSENIKRAAGENDFSEQPVPPSQSLVEITSVLGRMKEVNRSQNITKFRKKDYTRPSRRHPDNPNIPGRRVAKKFMPDLHLYADTSGSMSLEDYQDIALLLMQLARKLDVNVYFSSHSHLLSAEVMLPTQGKGIGAMRKILAAVPKVTGGNDFQLVYDYIQENPERQRRLNIIATDFGWSPNSTDSFVHPENLVYVPAFNRKNPGAWPQVRRWAAQFVNGMRAFDADVDRKLLGMGSSLK